MDILCSDLISLFLLLNSQDETLVGGSGTVVRRSPRGSQSSGLIRDPSSLVSLLHLSHDSVHKKTLCRQVLVKLGLLSRYYTQLGDVAHVL